MLTCAKSGSILLSASGGWFKDFSTLANAALHMTSEKHAIKLSGEDEAAVAEGMKKMPPFPDVNEALDALRKGGLRIVALSNGKTSATRTLLENSGLDG